jgi:hypothetical protein
MHVIYIISRLLQITGWLLAIGGVSIMLLDAMDVPQFGEVDGSAIIGGGGLIIGYVMCLCTRGLDYCLRHTPWISEVTVSV